MLRMTTNNKMKSEEIKFFEQKLLQEKNKIEKQLSEMDENVDFGSDIDSLEEESDESEESLNILGVKEVFKSRLLNIEAALEKITNNTFGVCQKCGKIIEKEILEIVPESALCKSCKTL